MVWIAGLCAVCLGICLPLFMHYKRSLHPYMAASYKAIGTLCAFLPALVAAIRLDPHCTVCAAALFLYAAADFLLEFNFMFGAGFFLLGHICSVAFFLSVAPVSMLHLLSFLLLSVTVGMVYYRWRKPIGKQMPVFIVYGLSLVLMSACALGCFPVSGVSGILIASGGALFCVSDFMLLRRLLFPSDRSLSWAVMITYYAAVLLYGISCLYL